MCLQINFLWFQGKTCSSWLLSFGLTLLNKSNICAGVVVEEKNCRSCSHSHLHKDNKLKDWIISESINQHHCLSMIILDYRNIFTSFCFWLLVGIADVRGLTTTVTGRDYTPRTFSHKFINSGGHFNRTLTVSSDQHFINLHNEN